MEFTCRRLFHDYQVFFTHYQLHLSIEPFLTHSKVSFAIRGDQLLIQACRQQAEESNDVWELIPNTIFSGELPYPCWS